MKTRDAEALEFIANSGQWRVLDDGTIETCRDRQGRPTDPQVWRLATFLSPSRQSSTRKRLWCKGQRVYANRAVWRLTHGPIPEGYQVDHKDSDSLNDAPGNLQLLDSAGNLDKEANRPGTNVRRFCPGSYADVGSRAAEPTEEQKYLRPYFYNEPTPAEVLAKFGDSCDKIDDAVEAQDWRISLTHDIKVGVLRWWQSARLWFDRTFLGFRY